MNKHSHKTTKPENNCCSTVTPAATTVNGGVKADRQTTLRVEGMDCADEVAAIQRAFQPIEGIQEIRPDLMKGTVLILHEGRVTSESLIKIMSGIGLRASDVVENSPSHAEEHNTNAQRKHLLSVLTSGVSIGVGLLLQWQGLFDPYGQIAAFAIAVISGGWFIFPKAVRALKQRSLDMNVLMTVAVIGAAAIGEWSEGAAVAFLFALSELLESLSVVRARRAIQALLKLSPETALVKRDSGFQEVRVEEVKVDDIISVKSGARVPLDGIVLSGQSAINQAPITGESMPVEKRSGDTVFAGTINGEGSLEIKVTKASTDTTLAKIIKLVGDVQSQKAPSQSFVDRFAKIYTPAVFILAIVVLFFGPLFLNADWSVWIYRSLVLLVIACPCALVISTPVSIVSGLTAMARRGILIKGGVYLEEVGRLKALAVDKTGTITEGNPRVTDVKTFESHSKEDIVRIAASIDTHSTHPLAQAVVRYAEGENIQFSRCEDYQARTGRGAEGKIDGCEYFVGNHPFAHELGVCSPDIERILVTIEEQALSVVIVGHKPHGDHKGNVLGILAIGDTIRANAASAIEALHRAGVEKVIMLSGDNQRTVDAIAKQAGIDEAFGGLLPENKVTRIKELVAKYKFVGMIGDGVNDAPAMAVATIGIAMGGVGTDTAIETADITLMKDDLSKVAETVILGRRTVRIIQFNIAFALLIKAVFLILAMAGHTSLWLAILADTGATLIVIANALRLLRS